LSSNSSGERLMTQTFSNLKHVAIIMDGNGRWAQARSHRRVWGHIRGARVVSRIVEEASDQGIQALTLYAFSSENWSRPLDEIQLLFSLLKKFLMGERERIIANRIRFRVMGEIATLPAATQELILNLQEVTRDFDGMKLNFAFSYGGRDEIVRAVNRLRLERPGELITEQDIQQSLYLPDLSDVDLMIRTGGDHRISNFLLWQMAYAELYFTPTKWPDFTCEEFRQIILDVVGRERRFGGVSAGAELAHSAVIAKKNRKLLEQGTLHQ
jgi:undecaprenyl diphosphate synthase